MTWLSRRIQDTRDFWLATRAHQAGVVPSALRYLRLALEEGYSPAEIIMLGLLDPREPTRSTRNEISKSKMLILQERINPREKFHLTEDKIVFFRHCRNLGLPTPEILAIYCERQGKDFGLTQLRTTAELAAFLDGLLLDDVVLKPVHGVHGQGVLILTRNGQGYQDVGSGKNHDAATLTQFMKRFPYSEWMLQQRLFGHPELCALSNTQSLQTARVVTYASSPRESSIVGARLRIIASGAGYDNFNFGASGNLLAAIDPERGVLATVLGVPEKHRGTQHVSNHPRSGRALQGFRLPDWDGVRCLALQGAQAFWPLRTVGWDIGITSKGPSLIEGNVTWDTLPGDGDFRRFHDSLGGA